MRWNSSSSGRRKRGCSLATDRRTRTAGLGQLAAHSAALAAAILLAGCSEQDGTADGESEGSGSRLHFTDVTASSGIDMTTTTGRTPPTQILEVKGGGLGLIDYDGDGDSDVFVPNGATLESPYRGPGCRLFRNDGGLRFRDVTAAAGLSFDRWGYGVAVGDYDNDGFDDLYVTCYGGNALLRNTGSGGFEEVTAEAGVAGDAWSTASTFGDLDNDGDLDLYVTNYLELDTDNLPPPGEFLGMEVFKGPIGLPPRADVLYENQGDGTFREISESSGILAPDPAYGLGAVILDFDGDHRADIYVGNDSLRNFLFRNLGGNRFELAGLESGIGLNQDGRAQATMGIAVGDVDGNGTPDLFTTNFINDTNTLHVNLGDCHFEDRTKLYGCGLGSSLSLSWATCFFDFDHDADEDLVVFNGHIYPEEALRTFRWEYRQAPLLYAREGDRFRQLQADSAGNWLAEKHSDRSVAFGDLDADGDIDMVVTQLNGPVRVLRNDRDGGNWLIVLLNDARPGRERRGFGSRITLRSAGSVQTRWIVGGTSFLAAHQPIAHFGLEQGVDSVELEVTWPDGHVQSVAGVAPGQHLTIERD